ncbi:MAG: YbbR-like domain-containing protein [Thermomicrobiales bacterium]
MTIYQDLRSRLTTAAMIRLGSSLVLALILWGWVTTSEDPQRSKQFSDVSIEVAGLKNGLQVVGTLPNALVTIKGPQSTIQDTRASDVSARLDIEHITGPGTYSVPVIVDAPDGVWDAVADPDRVSVEVEQTVAKQFTLEWEQSGTTDGTKRISSVVPQVSEVTVRGPSSVIDRLSRVALPIDITNKSGTFENSFTPEARDANDNAIPEVEISPDTIAATVVVSARGKSVAVITQLNGEPAPGYEVVDRTINPATVLVDGPQGLLNDLVAVSTEPIDVSGATSTVSKRVTIVGLPAGVQVIDPADGTVVAVVQIRQRGVTQPLPSQHIQFVNVGAGLTAEANPNEITVTVVGSQEALANLTADTIEVQIDVSGLGPGVYTLVPRVLLPPNVEWIDTNPATVTVTIQSMGTPTRGAAASPVASPTAKPRK